MHQYLIPRVVSKFLIPPILLFAFYVQFHGDFGPGGGFQAGVIFAAAFVLYALVFGRETAINIIPAPVLISLVAIGVLLYAGVGFVSLVMGGTFLDYSVLLENRVSGQHLGILLIELGVGITVAAVIIVIFFAFTGRGK